MGKCTKDKRDVYFRLSKAMGYRARSVFKLFQCDEQVDIILDGARNVVDLCCAPGSWSQALTHILNQSSENYKVVSVDLQKILPINGVTFIQGDIKEGKTATTIIEEFKGEKADIVVCDGAHYITGSKIWDELSHEPLLNAALAITTHILKPGGNYICKIFSGALTKSLKNRYGLIFNDVFLLKPASSRVTSGEHFLVCKGYYPPSNFYPNLKNYHALDLPTDVELTDAEKTHLLELLSCIFLGDFDNIPFSCENFVGGGEKTLDESKNRKDISLDFNSLFSKEILGFLSPYNNLFLVVNTETNTLIMREFIFYHYGQFFESEINGSKSTDLSTKPESNYTLCEDKLNQILFNDENGNDFFCKFFEKSCLEMSQHENRKLALSPLFMEEINDDFQNLHI